MARTGSVRLRGLRALFRLSGMLVRGLLDRAFLDLAVLAHAGISLLGAGSLALRLIQGEHPGSVLLRPSVLLFVLAGGCTAMLLVHVGRLLPPAPCNHHSDHDDQPYPASSARAASFDGILDKVGHDLRTPLNAIIGFSELMHRELLGPLGSPRYQEYARHIRDSGLAVLKAAEDTMALAALVAAHERASRNADKIESLLPQDCHAPNTPSRRVRGAGEPSKACRP